jgi:hypothetical protein
VLFVSFVVAYTDCALAYILFKDLRGDFVDRQALRRRRDRQERRRNPPAARLAANKFNDKNQKIDRIRTPMGPSSKK